jgi:hypothetical protein
MKKVKASKFKTNCLAVAMEITGEIESPLWPTEL